MSWPQLHRVVVAQFSEPDITLWLYAFDTQHALTTVQELCPNSRIVSVTLAPEWDDLT